MVFFYFTQVEQKGREAKCLAQDHKDNLCPKGVEQRHPEYHWPLFPAICVINR